MYQDGMAWRDWTRFLSNFSFSMLYFGFGYLKQIIPASLWTKAPTNSRLGMTKQTRSAIQKKSILLRFQINEIFHGWVVNLVFRVLSYLGGSKISAIQLIIIVNRGKCSTIWQKKFAWHKTYVSCVKFKSMHDFKNSLLEIQKFKFIQKIWPG